MEIKFRGKRIDNNEWVYGYYRKNTFYNKLGDEPKEVYTKHFIGAFNNLELFGGIFEQVEVKPESVGQLWEPSSGLTLYTGDLLHAECSPSGSNNKKQRLCKVGFSGNGMSIAVWHKKEWWAYSSMNFTTAKVVGNIIDNPELLDSV